MELKACPLFKRLWQSIYRAGNDQMTVFQGFRQILIQAIQRKNGSPQDSESQASGESQNGFYDCKTICNGRNERQEKQDDRGGRQDVKRCFIWKCCLLVEPCYA